MRRELRGHRTPEHVVHGWEVVRGTWPRDLHEPRGPRRSWANRGRCTRWCLLLGRFHGAHYRAALPLKNVTVSSTTRSANGGCVLCSSAAFCVPYIISPWSMPSMRTYVAWPGWKELIM